MMRETFYNGNDKNTENSLRITGDLHSSINNKKRCIEPLRAMSSESALSITIFASTTIFRHL